MFKDIKENKLVMNLKNRKSQQRNKTYLKIENYRAEKYNI